MNLAAGDHSSTLVFGSLFTTETGIKIEVSKFTVIFMPSIILGLFSLSTYSCSLACSTSSLSTSMFLLLFSDSLFVENCHELLLGNVIGNIVSLLYMGCQSTLLK